MLIRIELADKSDLAKLQNLPFDIPIIAADHADAVIFPGELSRLLTLGLRYEIIHEDLVKFYQSRNPLNLTMGGFPTFAEAVDIMDSLHTHYPAIVSVKWSVGDSWEGRDLWVFKISDNVNTDEDEPEIFYNALIHAREPASMTWQLHYAGWLCQNYGSDPTATEIVDDRELFFLPVFNPDGYEYNRQTNPSGGGMWRKNRRNNGGGVYGVDLNRNWGYQWGYDNNGSSPYTGDETYRGPSAFSEPETQAVRQFINSREFQFVVNAHTYGDYVLYPWGYDDIYTPDQWLFSVIGDSASALTGYLNGTAWELLYNTNGDSNDWQYGEQSEKPLIFCLTPESGNDADGFWPAAYRIPQINAEMLPFGIFTSLLGGNVFGLMPPVPPMLSPIGTVQSDPFTIYWAHDDPSNPAVIYELVEKTGYSRIADDFESGAENWVFNGFSISTGNYHSYNHSLFSGNENNYDGSAILAEPFTVEVGDSVIFYTWYAIEDGWDYAYVEISTDGGQNFNTLPGNITTNYDPHGNNRGNGITGFSSSWIQAKFPLTSYVGSLVILKLSYLTDIYLLESGIYFDDLFPVTGFATETVLASDITDEEYEISGRANGTYYYQVRAEDAENQWSLFSNLEVAEVDIQASIRGAVTDGSPAGFIEGAYVEALGSDISDSTDAEGEYLLENMLPGIYDVLFSHADYQDTIVTGVNVTAGVTTVVDMVMRVAQFAYLTGDANMFNEWVDINNPLTGPWRVGGDVTFLVNYLDVSSGNQPCLLHNPGAPPELRFFYASGDATGDCLVLGGDVSRLVQFFSGNPAAAISWCGHDQPDPENYYPPMWFANEEIPELNELPSGWPNCSAPPAKIRLLTQPGPK